MTVTVPGSVSVSESFFALTVVFDKISILPKDVGSSVESERFMTQHGTSLCVNMYIGGQKMENKDHCSLYLYSTDAVKSSCSMKLVNHKDDKKSIDSTFSSHDFKAGSGYGWPFFTKSENLLNPIHGFLVQDAITIEIEITIDGLQRVYDYRYSMAHEMKALLFDESTADHHIIVGHTDNDQLITSPSTTTCLSMKRSIEMTMIDSPVDAASYSNHILEQRSHVLKTMLSSAMKESTSNKIIITDFDHDVVRGFIRFLYLDTCDKEVLDQHAKSLLAMAHKYDVKGLLHISADYLIRTLSIDTAVELLQLADLYEVKGLKKKALKFIQTNLKALTKAGRLDPLSPELLHNLINHLADV
jgi:hypothetical protein